MGSTTTGLLGLYKPAAQEQNWDASVNANFDSIDQAIDRPLSRAFGLKTWNFEPILAGANTAPTSQTIYATPIYIPAGKVITNVVLGISTAGSGTTPAHFYVGLASPAKMVAQSNNLNASTSLTTAGMQNFALSATYTTNTTDSSSGLYYVVLLQDGAFGTTNPTFLNTTAQANASKAYGAGSILCGTLGTAQTALATNGTAVTVTAASVFWFAGVS
ncbi:MAG: hypothetical protein KGL39_42115 [Patescibacteria group bacterium]|nr:hypothetical protein [Patescibacteria group bacterium]